MLEPRHIMRLKLASDQLLAYRSMPPPEHASKELTSQMIAIGNATISNLLNLDPQLFEMQLDAARDFGASYLTEDYCRNIIGVSAATSLIKDDNVLAKNMILPREFVRRDPRLHAHYIVSVFLRGVIANGVVQDVSEVEVAGWTDTKGAMRNGRHPPAKFTSKIPVIAVPCTALNPINQLVKRLTEHKLCV